MASWVILSPFRKSYQDPEIAVIVALQVGSWVCEIRCKTVCVIFLFCFRLGFRFSYLLSAW